MSNIPFSAIGAALTPVQRSTNELLRARRVQLEKDSHHTEDVEELDETAVNAVKDGQEKRGGGRKERDGRRREGGEKVEIAGVEEAGEKGAGKGAGKGRGGAARGQLDISA